MKPNRTHYLFCTKSMESGRTGANGVCVTSRVEAENKCGYVTARGHITAVLSVRAATTISRPVTPTNVRVSSVGMSSLMRYLYIIP